MKIDFEQIPLQILKNFKGGEKSYDAKIYDDGQCKFMYGTLVPGASIGMHTHTDSCEIIFVVDGVGTIVSEDGPETLTPGTAHYCPKGHGHSLVNNGDVDLHFYAVVPNLPA